MYRYRAGKQDWAATGGRLEGKISDVPRLGDVARTGVPACGLPDRIADVREQVRAAGWDECVVVNEQNVVLGRLRPETLAGAGGEETAEAVMEAGPTSYRPNMRLEEAAKRMQDKDVASLLVTTSNGQLIGVLYRRDAEERLANKQQQG